MHLLRQKVKTNHIKKKYSKRIFKKMVRINIGEKQKILVGSIVIVLCLIALGFMYQNNIKAYYLGIDVRYLDDPLYCEKGDDCVRGPLCDNVSNPYHLIGNKTICKNAYFEVCDLEKNSCYLAFHGAAEE